MRILIYIVSRIQTMHIQRNLNFLQTFTKSEKFVKTCNLKTIKTCNFKTIKGILVKNTDKR